jgi:hypothetical protein
VDGTLSTPTFTPMDTRRRNQYSRTRIRRQRDNAIDHIRQRDEIYGIARAYDNDTHLEQPWAIDTLKSLIRRITNEGKLPNSNQANHPEVQLVITLDDAVLSQRIRQTYSRNNPDHKAMLLHDVEGMWMNEGQAIIYIGCE